ncbi:RNA-directed DNA polymerase, eukaryota, Reverse transcriptase zinc-binding domain protein [Artemisia annua]|uniref:RNA-directed DNA polymerase, eukaryota, Reverse transcriptase zinc-binding domain protein n=1 Tax=Artemisia annua TaxID=35608 RepID=A0A2U1PJQ4_ARTAN|nr:RNA-directed DNA polymerase, eukaryota, Reverse transcriptase zinc-binding domain protein [Artemisia annua]
MELCNGNGIGKIMSGIGKPMLMDKLTKERCLKKSGKLNFARVLVEVSAVDELPQFLEIEYLVIGDRPARIGRLEVKYQWKPPQCTHCKTFGHSTVSCKTRPITDEEKAAEVLKEALKVPIDGADVNVVSHNVGDGFVTIGKNNKPVVMQSSVKQSNSLNRNGNSSFNGKSSHNSYRMNGGVGRSNVSGKGANHQDRNGGSVQKQQGNVQRNKSVGGGSIGEQKSNKEGRAVKPPKGKSNIVHKPSLSSKYSADFQPKVLVRGSSSTNAKSTSGENVPVTNSFQVLEDQDMMDKDGEFNSSVDEEYKNVVWPKLQSEVVEVLVSGIYPSQEVRANWSLSQLDFFYQNCQKYGLEPYVDDDDVESEMEGMAVEMKPDNNGGSGFAWNIRGLNNDLNQKQVIDMLRNGDYCFCALLETKLKKKKLSKVCSKVLGNWEWISNAASCENGTGVVVGWNPNVVRIMLHNQTSQVMNVFVEVISSGQKFFCSFVYAYYKECGRRALWKELSKFCSAIRDAPWVLLGDFNVILNPSERSFGSSAITSGMEEFRDCIAKIDVSDLVMAGLQITWNKSAKSPKGLLKKLDRVMCNMAFLDKFPSSNAIFLPFVCFDHAPSFLCIPNAPGPKPKPFKFANFLASKAEFLPTVKGVWGQEIPGDLTEKVKSLRGKLCRVQEDMVKDPFNVDIRIEEAEVLKAYNVAARDEELFLKQRSKVSWLSEGDFNTKYFHNAMKERRNRSRIEYVEDLEGNDVTPPFSRFAADLGLGYYFMESQLQ